MWGRLKIDEPGGPVLKYVDPLFSDISLQDETHRDAGLFVNASEFLREDPRVFREIE
jgi:hypothetical protein